MYIITKEFRFEAAHSLPHLGALHKCSRVHGHSYRVIVELTVHELDGNGFVVDYGDLDQFKRYLDSTLDHRNLNDIFDVYTTAENIARHLYIVASSMWPIVTCVSVSETAATWASYRRDDL